MKRKGDLESTTKQTASMVESEKESKLLAPITSDDLLRLSSLSIF